MPELAQSFSYQALILDRDGVINADSSNYIRSPEEWQPLPGSLEAIAKVKRLGIPVGVITNQSGVGRGYYDLATLAAIHDKMHSLLWEHSATIDSLLFCPHHPKEGCTCRKPQSTMLTMCCQNLGVSPTEVLYIGDKKSDYETAMAAGSHFALVRTGYGEETLKSSSKVSVYADLAAAVEAMFPTL